MWDILKEITDPKSIIMYGGLALLMFVVFAETGLLIGFFLPGDSLIFISGVTCRLSPDLLHPNIFVLMLLLTVAAVAGNIVGFWFGRKVGPALFKRPDSLIFRKRRLEMTREFYEKNGGATLIIGRFLPVIRTFAPIFAGIIGVPFSRFMAFNVAGAAAWIFSLAGAGYYLGGYKWVSDNIGLIVIGLIVITLIPLVLTGLKVRRSARR